GVKGQYEKAQIRDNRCDRAYRAVLDFQCTSSRAESSNRSGTYDRFASDDLCVPRKALSRWQNLRQAVPKISKRDKIAPGPAARYCSAFAPSAGNYSASGKSADGD